MTARYLWTVVYQRADWKQPQQRAYLYEHAARRHIAKLTSTGRGDLAPLTTLTLTRRSLGAEVAVESFR